MAVDDRVIAALPFAAWLSADQRRALGAVLVERAFAPDAVIFARGAPGRSCAFIVAGEVHVEIEGEPGRPPARINTMAVGEVFGEVALLDGGARSATCRAGAEGARVAELTRDDFSLLFDANSPFAFALIRQISGQLARRIRDVTHRWREAAEDTAG